MSSCFGEAILACLAFRVHQTMLSYWLRISIWCDSGESFLCMNELQHSCYQLIYAFADHATSLIIGNDACAINITASVASWVIGRWLAEKTKHSVRCFYQDTLTIGTGRQNIIPSRPSSLMDIHLHDFAVVTGAFLGSIQLRRIFLPWGAAPSNCALFVLQIILHYLVSYEATATDIGKLYAISHSICWRL